ncbi:MAG: hypothetical protein KDB03_14530 [Planctomycetales bacterium]|nr:hypothetical protein [Planctomycetales bacterium]
MPLGIGYFELAAILFCSILVFAMYLGRLKQRSRFLVLLGCVVLASVLTPADLFSMLVMAVAFLAVYFWGTRHPFRPSPAAA